MNFCRGKKNETVICRICFTGKSTGELVSPCRCRGTLGLVHEKCLLSWLEVKKNSKCELCDIQLPVKRVPKHFTDWIKESDGKIKCYAIIDIICSLLLAPFTLFSIFLCIRSALYSSQNNWDSVALISIIFLLVSSFLLWTSICIERHLKAFRVWQTVNFKVVLEKMPKEKVDPIRKNASHPLTASPGCKLENSASLHLEDLPLLYV